MDHGEYVDAIRSDGAALADAARAAGIDAPVPSCPLWSIADLLAHIGRIHRWVTQLVVERASERGAHWSEAQPPPPGERIDWFAAGVPALADALAVAGPATAMWSWTPDRTSGFWARRQAHETAMHRFDAQLAAACAEPIARTLAVDGIDELFSLVAFVPWAERVRGDGETLHVHCTDGEHEPDGDRGEWLARFGADGFVFTREHAKADVAVRGPASDLLCFLYGRVGADRLEVFGDPSLLARQRELLTW